MQNIIYVTSNQKKAEYLSRYLNHPILYKKIELDEIQSLDLRKIVKHKVRQAYDLVKKPVVVEDTSIEFSALGGLPGAFAKYFLEQMPLEDICSLLGDKDRSATARCVFGYFDGKNDAYFEGILKGAIAEKPSGNSGLGFDPIFIPEGFTVTRASLNEKDYEDTYIKLKPVRQLADFLKKLK